MNNQRPDNNNYLMKIEKGETPISFGQEPFEPQRRPPVAQPKTQPRTQPRIQSPNNTQPVKNKSKKKKKISKREHFTISDDEKNTVSKINKSIDKINDDQTSTEETIDIKPKKSKIPQFLKEPLLLLTLYVILSLSFVKNFFGKYIQFINPNENGDVSILGIIIYGTILTMLFFFSKVVLL